MNRIKISFIILVTLLVTAGSILAGGGSRNGTAGATQLLVPVGARGIAMGEAAITNTIGVDALYWNPANLSLAKSNTNALFSHMNYIADIGVEYGAVSTRIDGFGSVALNIKSFDIGDIPVTTTDNPDGTGGSFSPQFITIGLTYSTLLSDRISVGLTMNYITEQLDLASASGISFNVGVTYRSLFSMEGLTFAIVMKNIGPQMTYDGTGLLIAADPGSLSRPEQFYKMDAAGFELPSTFELGLGYNYNIDGDNALLASTSFRNNNFYADEYQIGAEYSYSNMFFVRGGYTMAPDLESDANIFGLTFGAGLKYNMSGLDVSFDYAYKAVEYEALGDNHIFTILLGI